MISKKGCTSRSKITFWLSIFVFGTGLLFLLPYHPKSWFRLVHLSGAVLLAFMLLKIMSSHVTMHLSNPFKSGIKKWNGFKYLLYLILAFISGILLVCGMTDSWLKNFHLGIGAWSLLVGWKHTKTN